MFILLGFALFYRVNGVIAGCMRYLSIQPEYYAVTHSNLDMDCVERHLKDLLEGAVTAWNVVADVTVSNDRPEAQVSADDGIAIQVTCRPGPTGGWQWVLFRLNGGIEQPQRRLYPSVLTMLRALREELAPEQRAYGLVITPKAGSL